MSRVLVFPEDTIAIRDTETHTTQEYTIEQNSSAPAGCLFLRPSLPTEPGYYMTTNNVDTGAPEVSARLHGVIIELDNHGNWSVLSPSYDSNTIEGRDRMFDLITQWHRNLGLTRIYLTTERPA